jgi:DNA-binding IclR family transcriptional regulator
MTALARILSALEEAPSTASELAMVAGIPEASIRGQLSELRRMGLVERAGKVTTEITFQRRVVLWKRSQR